MAVLNAFHVAAAEAVPVAVRFTITDQEGRSLASVPVRLVFGHGPGWQQADAGHRFATDAAGEHRLAVVTPIERRLRKMPTNFVDSLFSRARPTDFLQVSAELGYAGVRRLHVIEIHRFQEGTVLRENFSIYSADGNGNFTRRAGYSGRDWKFADLGGLVLNGPGNEMVAAAWQPDPDDPTGQRWTLDLAFKRSPDPIRR